MIEFWHAPPIKDLLTQPMPSIKKEANIDFERKTIHLRPSKYKKDRIMPLRMKKEIGNRTSAEYVVHPGFHAGSCRPHEVLFIITSPI